MEGPTDFPPPQGLAATLGDAFASATSERPGQGPGRTLSLSYHRHLSGTDARLWELLFDG